MQRIVIGVVNQWKFQLRVQRDLQLELQAPQSCSYTTRSSNFPTAIILTLQFKLQVVSFPLSWLHRRQIVWFPLSFLERVRFYWSHIWNKLLLPNKNLAFELDDQYVLVLWYQIIIDDYRKCCTDINVGRSFLVFETCTDISLSLWICWTNVYLYKSQMYTWCMPGLLQVTRLRRFSKLVTCRTETPLKVAGFSEEEEDAWVNNSSTFQNPKLLQFLKQAILHLWI